MTTSLRAPRPAPRAPRPAKMIIGPRTGHTTPDTSEFSTDDQQTAGGASSCYTSIPGSRRRELARLVDSERFPDVAELLRSNLFEPAAGEQAAAPDDESAFGLTLILDGIAASVARTPI